MKKYKIIIQRGIVCKSFTLEATNKEDAHQKAEAIINPRFVITDVLSV
jgi:hypothetical protein